MKKEEFLAMSFTYGLKCKLNQVGIFNLDEEYPEPHNEICEITNILKLNESFEYEISDGNIGYGFIGSEEFDIILHPLSDLTKEIEHNGERFIPLHKLLEMNNFNLSKMSKNEINSYECVFNSIDVNNFNDAMYLISIHFDLFDLISKNEAIDVNTLETNPYR